MSGVLERHGDLRILLAHGGGALPWLRGRLRHAHEHLAAAQTRLGEPVEASLRRLHYDTVTHDPDLLRALAEFAGADRLVLGLGPSVRHGRSRSGGDGDRRRPGPGRPSAPTRKG